MVVVLWEGTQLISFFDVTHRREEEERTAAGAAGTNTSVLRKYRENRGPALA